MGVIGDTEKQLIDMLSGLNLGISVEAYPEDPESYQLTHSAGALLVKYAGSDYQDLDVQQRLVQSQNMQFDVYVVTRNLKTHTGAYEVIDKVLDGISGKEVSGGTLVPVKDGFLYQDKKIWYHLIVFELRLKVSYA